VRKLFTPHGYQSHIIDHILENERCAAWAGMGMGKTSSTLTAISNLILAGEDAPTLVLAPLRVAKGTWPNEAKKWQHLAGLDIVPVVGSEAERRMALKMDAPVYTCNYDNLVWLVDHFGDKWPFQTVISDEATRLKSFRLRQGGVRTRALGRVAHTKIKRFVQLTGTPSPNGLQDLWGQMWFLDAGQRLGRTYSAFRDRWFTKSFDGYGTDPQPFAQEQIQDKLRDICLTIEAKDWFDLREPIVNNLYVELPVKARIQYREMEKQMFTEIDGHGVEAFNAAARTQKCLQLASGNVWVEKATDTWREVHDAKLQALESILEEANGMPVLVAYQWIPSKERILKAFPKARFLDADPQTEADWNAGKIPLLVAHPQSAGHGLNLQDGGNIIAFYDHWWNLEEYQQIIERIGPTRQLQAGYERPVFIHHIIARDTVDEDVMVRRESKREVQDILMSSMKRRAA